MLERLDRSLLWVTSCSILLEIALNFIGSYGHTYVLGLQYGETGWADARILPVCIDGVLMALAATNVLAARLREERKSPWQLRLGLIGAVGSTVAANAAFGEHWGTTGALLATWMPVALAVTVETGLYAWRLVGEYLERTAKAITVTELKEKRREASRRSRHARAGQDVAVRATRIFDPSQGPRDFGLGPIA